MTIIPHTTDNLLLDIVIYKILLVDLLRIAIKWAWRFTKWQLIRTEQDALMYLRWRNQTIKNRLRK